jgi:hypothetical protein
VGDLVTDLDTLAVGDRVRCTGPLNDGCLGTNYSLVGVEGTVCWVGQFTDHLTSQVAVDWDNGSKLNLLPGDPFVRLMTPSTKKGRS